MASRRGIGLVQRVRGPASWAALGCRSLPGSCFSPSPLLANQNADAPSLVLSSANSSLATSKDRGQPSPETHPQLLRPGEILPGIKSQDFAERRARVMERLPDGAALLVPAAPIMRKAGGLIQQAAWGGVCAALVRREPGGTAHLSLFTPILTREAKIWDGHLMDADDALRFFAADDAQPLTQIHAELRHQIKRGGEVFFDATGGAAFMRQCPALSEAATAGLLKSPIPMLHQQRWIKSSAEIDLMRKSASIVSDAMEGTMKLSRATARAGEDVSERVLCAEVEARCFKGGAQHMAFPSVVAGGENACIIHYSRHDHMVRPGEMLLVDAGCEYFGYVSDLTRAWVPHGKASSAQRDVHEAVLEVANECIAMCRPGATLQAIHQHSVRALSKQLVRLGVFPGADPERVAKSGAFKWAYPTSVGHWLGLDTHDCSTVLSSQQMQPGVVLTIEPGLYLPSLPEVPKHLRGIGVRIEDDILITEFGHEVLTQASSSLEAIDKLLSSR